MNPSPGNNWAAERYWVSTTNATGALYYVTLIDDSDSKGYFTGSSPVSDGAENSVCVRGSTTAISLIDSPKNFKNNGDGTVSDLNTGLVWQQNDSGASTLVWNDSVAYCDGLDMSGYTDWRLPTVSEATTFIDYGSSNYRDSAFTSGYYYHWTMTTLPTYVGFAYDVLLGSGLVFLSFKGGSSRARCVRDH